MNCKNVKSTSKIQVKLFSQSYSLGYTSGPRCETRLTTRVNAHRMATQINPADKLDDMIHIDRPVIDELSVSRDDIGRPALVSLTRVIN